MASLTTTKLTILLGFTAAFWCLEALESASNSKIQASPSPAARLAAGVFLPAVLATFGLTLLFLVAHVRVLGRGNAAGARLPACLAQATLAATATALLAGIVLRLVAGGHLGGADDVGWLNNSENGPDFWVSLQGTLPLTCGPHGHRTHMSVRVVAP